MIDIVTMAVKLFYVEKNYDLFRESARRPLELSEDIQHYIEHTGLRVSGSPNNQYYPSRLLFIHFHNYKKNEFDISYRTILQISKVTSVFNVQHEFNVRHKNKNYTAPSLGFYSDKPYTIGQSELHNKIATILGENGYEELKRIDMDEVVEGFKMPEEISIWGLDVTVELLLFRDLFNILDDSNED